MISAEQLLKSASPSSASRYKANCKKRSPNNIINGQRECIVSNHRLGLRKMAKNGCGPIAVYNALFFTGQSPDFNTVALGIDMYALRLGGLLGTDEKKLDECFSKCHIAAVRAKDYDDFCRVLPAVRAGLLCYWIAKPKKSLLHFVTVINHNGKLLVCNRYCNTHKPSPVMSIEKFCSPEQYVSGFFFN